MAYISRQKQEMYLILLAILEKINVIANYLGEIAVTWLDS
jgi:hypothetical protein